MNVTHPVLGRRSTPKCAIRLAGSMARRPALQALEQLLIGTLLLCTVLMFGLSQATAAERSWPTRAVKIIVPASVGTGADMVARILGQRLSEAWGQPVVIENRDGASGNLGAAIVAKAPPDGYTLVMAFLNHAISPSLYSNIPFDIVRDFKPIVRTAVAPMVIFAHPSFVPNSIPELITLAKTRTNNNQIFFGSPGMASVNGLALEILKSRAGIEMTHTPYKGSAQMVTDVLGNQIPMATSVIAAVLPQLQAGKIKALAVTSAKRSSSLPNVPTVAEAGLDNYDVAAWNGLLAPLGTPDAIIAEVYSTTIRVMQTREVNEQLQKLGMDLALQNPAEFKAYITNEVQQWAKIVKDTGAKAD